MLSASSRTLQVALSIALLLASTHGAAVPSQSYLTPSQSSLLPGPSAFHSGSTNLSVTASISSSSSASLSDVTSSSALSSIVTPSSSLVSTSLASVSLSTSSSSLAGSGSASPVSSSTTTASAGQPSQTLDPGTSADIETIRDRRLTIIIEGVGSPANISAWLSTLGDDGKWPDSEIDYTTGCTARRANWPAEDHWSRIVTMAAAWHGGLDGAGSFVNSSTLFDAISGAMDFWFMNDFTVPGCLDSGGLPACPCGTPGFWNTNWFSNIIGVPEFVGEACLLVGQENLTPTQVSNCTNILDRSFGTFGRNVNGLGFLTGANTLDVAKIGIDSGLLTENATLIADGYQRIHNEVVVQNAIKADGIRADGSFGQHGGIIYNGNYGKDYTNDVLALEIAGAGTQYSAQNDGTGSQAAFETLLDGDLWMIYRNVLTNVLHWDFSVLPRFITFPVSDNQATGSIKINISQIEELGTLWGSDTIQSVYESLASSSEDANAGKIHGNRMFYDNDYMVQRGDGYVSTLRMYSSRTQNTECVNSQNPFGFHLSDGTLYTYLQGNEYEDIAAAWDWNLIPGTTTDYAATNLSCDHTQFTGVESFVGGASDGSVGVAAMSYTNPFTRTLSFQKAWFFLDEDVQHIMLPSAISNASADHPVISVLDQKRLNGPVYVNGRVLPKGGNFSRPQSLWHDNVGYAFDCASPKCDVDLAVDFGARSGNWSAIGISTAGEITVDLFSAWIDHGVGTDLDVPTAYTVFPATSLKEFQHKSANTRKYLKTIRNDADVSAVYDAEHRTVMVVFWVAQGGSVTFSPSFIDAPITIEASANSAVIYKLDEGAVMVSDPSQSVSTLQLTFKVGLIGRRPQGWGWKLTKTVETAMPTGGVGGKSVPVTL
ncbi:polysaccharide lyase family 8 protein [Lentinus tigrinus ALCF2SS1-7]|uniref:Polysaccharide lyase family 8 protein n=1 Tax=Lentinus tigrinus ALCF2SS1-6 TaxID=1328759 RepID=A0A5C2S2Y9_9APHY|nr:polysaccharide lyase family 8 protein [Lentinus tigrinus ALCF2SS1-6]RPD69014.1 polysaccharide lyase family 8 protein [Lentinus tigrinus ALCF2SS1-7]